MPLFVLILRQGDTVDQDEVTRVLFSKTFTSSSPSLSTFRADLFAYTKEGEPNFARDQQGTLVALRFAIANMVSLNQKAIC